MGDLCSKGSSLKKNMAMAPVKVSNNSPTGTITFELVYNQNVVQTILMGHVWGQSTAYVCFYYIKGLIAQNYIIPNENTAEFVGPMSAPLPLPRIPVLRQDQYLLIRETYQLEVEVPRKEERKDKDSSVEAQNRFRNLSTHKEDLYSSHMLPKSVLSPVEGGSESSRHVPQNVARNLSVVPESSYEVNDTYSNGVRRHE